MRLGSTFLRSLGLRRSNRFSGHVDGLFGCVLQGWAVGSSESNPAEVSIFVDGRQAFSTLASEFRGDLREEGICGGHAGFSWTIPWRFFDGETHRVSVVNRSSGFPLGNADLTFKLERPDATPRETIKEILFTSGVWADLVDKAKVTRKVAVVASYCSHSEFLMIHRRLFKDLSSKGYTVIVSHADGSDKPIRERAYPISADCVIYRENSGYDFGSWTTGLGLLSDVLDQIDELILVNDSMFGSVEPIIDKMNRMDGSFQCVTDSHEREYHAQSYMMRFKKDALVDPTLRNFFLDYKHYDDKSLVISKGELGLSNAMLSAGFELSALCPYYRVASSYLDELPETVELLRSVYSRLGFSSNTHLEDRLQRVNEIAEMLLSGVPMNPSHFFWRSLISKYNISLIKRELLLINPAQVPDLILAQILPFADAIVDKQEVREFIVRERATPGVWAQLAIRSNLTPAPVEEGMK